jgi:pyridoxine 5-phosphate synthase
MVELGVNIDHVATVREARQGKEPDPVWAAVLAELGGADGITIHLREDRRHIQDRDVEVLRETVNVKLNLEMACDPGVVQIACRTRPEQVTLVPEKREELTTEGGLDIVAQRDNVAPVIQQLQEVGILVSLFLDPIAEQIDMAAELGVAAVELHTGQYAIQQGDLQQQELVKLNEAGQGIVKHGMILNAGHGLNYQNVAPIAALDQMVELNIGHSIIARAMMVGMRQAVYEMKQLLQ